MSLFHIRGMKILTHKLKFVPYLKHLVKFHLDLHSMRYINSPKVSCLGMNPRICWKHDLEESYLLEYSESKVGMFTQCSIRTSLWPVKI